MPLFLFFSFLIYSIIYFSPSFFPLIENDSLSYVNNESIRLSLYPFIIDIFNEKMDNILYFQVFLLSISLSLLIFSLIKQKINKFLIFIFFLLIVFNFYYTSFSKTILVEVFYFAAINISVSLILLYKNSKNRFILSFIIGIFLGTIIALRHEGLIISLFLFSLIIFIESHKLNKNILLCFLALFVIPLFEIHEFYKNNESRNSVVENSILGKIFMLSGFENFEIDQDLNMHRELLNEFSEESREINIFLQDIKNPYIKNNLFSDYEVVAQYQINDLLGQNSSFSNYDFNGLQSRILFEMIKNQPQNFIKLSISHYFALWMPGGKQIFFDDSSKNKQNIPFYNLLKKSSGQINILNEKLLLSALFFFQILMFFSLFLLLYSFSKLIFGVWRQELIIISFTILIQVYLISVSFINIGTPRYLMPVYPFILICLILSLDKFLIKKLYRGKNDFFSRH